MPEASWGKVRATRGYRLKSRYARLREAGLLTAAEMAADLGVCKTTVHAWHRHGVLRLVNPREEDVRPTTDSNVKPLPQQ